MTEKKSNTTYTSVRGEIYWAKLWEFNRDKEGPDGAWSSKGGATTVDVWMDVEEFDKLKELGCGIEVPKPEGKANKVLEDGRYQIRFKRFWDHEFPTLGGAPQVAHADGSDWDPDKDGLIGNGSEAIIYLSIYGKEGRKGTRLDGVQVVNHIPYKSEKSGSGRINMPDLTKDEGVSDTKQPESPELEDEIPF